MRRPRLMTARCRKTKGGLIGERKQNSRYDDVYAVCGADCGGYLHPDSDSRGSLYAAIFIYHAGRPAAGRAFGRGQRGPLYCHGADRPARFCTGRRDRVCSEAQLWLYRGLCNRRLRNGSARGAGGIAGVRQASVCQFCRACDCLFLRDDLLRAHQRLLPWGAHRALAALFVLLSSGCTGRYCPVPAGGRGCQTGSLQREGSVG